MKKLSLRRIIFVILIKNTYIRGCCSSSLYQLGQECGPSLGTCYYLDLSNQNCSSKYKTKVIIYIAGIIIMKSQLIEVRYQGENNFVLVYKTLKFRLIYKRIVGDALF